MNMTELLTRLWLATLALSLGLVLVALLRQPWRRSFGSEQACHLWWLPILAMAASLLPHPEHGVLAKVLPATVPLVLPPATPAPTSTNAFDWPALLVLAWLTGVATCLLLALLRQWRFHSRLHATPATTDHATLPVLRASTPDIGPALLGLWRQRIVVPNDFEQRYNAEERKLILAHEASHASRHDTATGCLAELLRAAFWFNPLAHWALRRLRMDQEIACDARVMRIHPRTRRRYAETLLRTQAITQPLPVGCAWPSHPIKERIMMLKACIPNRLRRRAGTAMALCLGLCLVGSVYATTRPPTATSTATDSSTYQLSMVLTRNGTNLASPTVCVKPNTKASIEQYSSNDEATHKLHLDLRVTPLSGQRVKVAVTGTLADATGTIASIESTFNGSLGHTQSTRMKTPNGGAPVLLAIIPSKGCSAAPRPPMPPAPPSSIQPPPPLPPPPPPPPAMLQTPPPLPVPPKPHQAGQQAAKVG